MGGEGCLLTRQRSPMFERRKTWTVVAARGQTDDMQHSYVCVLKDEKGCLPCYF